jgi:hypothetical protein
VAERSTPPVRSSGGIAGPRLPLAVAGFAGLASILALVVAAATGAFSSRQTESLAAELSGQQAAAEQALAALEEAKPVDPVVQTARRASELALFATLRVYEARKKSGDNALVMPASWPRGEGERVGLIDFSHNRIVTFEGLADGATLSASLPELAKIMVRQSSDRAEPLVVEDPDGAWAIGTPIAAELYAVARVERPKLEADPIDRARRLIGAIASPSVDAEAPADPLPILIIAALLAAIGAGVWAWRRVTHPIARALDIGREFAHGRTEVRADPNRGAREAREVALAINALIERAERAMEKGRAARGDDLSNAVTAIERLGKGDLRDAIVPPGPTFGPIAQAIEGARRDLLERVTEMHTAAMQVANRAAEMAPAAKAVGETAGEQLATLKRMAGSSDESLEEIRKKATELEVAINALTRTAQDHRQVVQEVRASLSGLSRKVMSLKGTAEEAHALAARAESIDQALSMLSRLAGQSDVPATKTRATALVGDARAALSEIGEKLQALEQEMLRSAHGLEIMAQAQPEPPKMFEASVTQPFYDASSILVRTVELTVGCLSALERTSKTAVQSCDVLYEAARRAVDLVPRLGAAVSAIRLGTSFEEQLLERLARMKAEVDAARRTEGLTPDGQRMLAEVEEASEAARAKLTRLAHATETAIRAMRGS